MKKLFTYLFIISIAFIHKAGAQQAGVLDTSYNHTGFNVIQNGNNNDNEAYAMAIQADGKAVVAGYILYSDTEKLLVERYKTDGTLDNTFNGTGMFYFVTGENSEGDAIAIQSDGKILVGGYAFISGNQNDFLLLRLNSDGTLDKTFGVNGVETLDFTDGQMDNIYCMGIQSDGKILAAGSAVVNGNYNFAIARWDGSGNLDNSFGQEGRVWGPIGSGASVIYAMALQADGKIVLGGYSITRDSVSVSTMCRLTPAGIADTTFNDSGIVITPMTSFDNQINGINIQPDGKIVTSGYANNNSNYGDFALARYNADGSLDNTFNNTGKVITDFGGKDDEAFTISLQPDGKIIACGFAFIEGESTEFALARYNNNGSLDAGFGNGGLASTAIGSSDDEIFAAALQPDGKLVVAGSSENSTNYNLTVARYLTGISTGVLDFNMPVNAYLIYPNPATTNTELEYELQNTEPISVQVFDISGKLTSTVLNNETQAAGKHSLTIHFGNQLSAGTYFVRIMTASGQVSVKMVKE